MGQESGEVFRAWNLAAQGLNKFDAADAAKKGKRKKPRKGENTSGLLYFRDRKHYSVGLSTEKKPRTWLTLGSHSVAFDSDELSNLLIDLNEMQKEMTEATMMKLLKQ